MFESVGVLLSDMIRPLLRRLPCQPGADTNSIDGQRDTKAIERCEQTVQISVHRSTTGFYALLMLVCALLECWPTHPAPRPATAKKILAPLLPGVGSGSSTVVTDDW